MSQKHFNINTFIAILVITAVVAGWGIVYFGAKDTPYNYNATHFTSGTDTTQPKCTYADGKCPTLLKYTVEHNECMEAMDSTYVAMHNRIVELEAQLAGCEFQEHSKLTEYAAQ